MKKPTAQHEWELVTPALAEEYLSKNENRRLRASQVAFLSQTMKAGEFKATHQGVAFTKSGRLVDGQHRLHAIILSGKSVYMLVVRGLDEDVFEVLDCGVQRTIADRLRITPRLASIASSMIRCAKGRDKKVAAYEAEVVLDAFKVQFKQIEELGLMGSARKIAVSPIAAAALLRLYEFADSGLLGAVQDRITILATEDLARATPLLLTFYKQALSYDRYGATAQKDLFLRAWIAFDPKRTEQSKLIIKDGANLTDEARDVFDDATAGNF